MSERINALLRAFAADRPDMADLVGFEEKLGMLHSDAAPQFALWLIANGHAQEGAFERAVELKAVAEELRQHAYLPLIEKSSVTAASVMAVRVHDGIADGDILDLMRLMKRARDEDQAKCIVALFDGFGEDPRDLVDIPEVRETCQRLVSIGFVSLLDLSTQYPPNQPIEVRAALGLAEVYLIGQNRFRPGIRASLELFSELREVAIKANESSKYFLSETTATGAQ